MPSLQGLKILITRPEKLSAHLSRLIENEGGSSVLYPVISITDPDHLDQRDQILKQLASFDIAIFISPTAVQKTFEQIDRLPKNIVVAAIGSSTTRNLDERGIHVNIIPEGHDSESLLAHEQLQATEIVNKSIVIFRGQGGRNLLGDTLHQRGARVVYAEMYKRVRPEKLTPLTAEQLGAIDIITVTSNEGLQNLFDLTADKALLLARPIIVPGQRCYNLASSLGFHHIIQSENATDVACIEAIRKWAIKLPA